MNKMLLVMAAGALFAAGTALAQSETVTSVNVVGYYSVTIPNNGAAFATPVLESFQSGTIGDLLGTQLPVGSKAYLWDRINKEYVPFTSVALFGGGYEWRDKANKTATNVILRGDAMWLKPPAAAGEITVTFMGEVPGSYNDASTTTVHNISLTDAVGYTYPVDVLWTNTAIAKLPNVTTVHFWNGSGWSSYNKYSVFGGGYTWSPSDVLSKLVKAGEAFWVGVSAPLDWTEEAPYDL